MRSTPIPLTLNESTRTRDEARRYRGLLVSVCLFCALCICAVFLGTALATRSLIRHEMLSRTRSDFANLVRVRQWNAQYGGVFVEKSPGVDSNPYLRESDVTTVDGRVFTKKSPELMTRELSDAAKNDKAYTFHITSLRPLDPGNAPDAHERQALLAFEAGETERAWIEEGPPPHFRYMAPLRIEASCLSCHAEKDHQVGTIRGGISVSFDITDSLSRMRRNLWLIVVLAIATCVLLPATIMLFMRRLSASLKEVRGQLDLMARVDPLTGLANRRNVLEQLGEEIARHLRTRDPLSCLIMDVDRLRAINDSRGHQIGDKVIQCVAACLKSIVRTYDCIGRYGGQEFIVVLPGAESLTASAIAERLRRGIENIPEEACFGVTMSIGVATMRENDTAESFLHRADEHLQRAKTNGRNRVVGEF
jgi:diguanylate cyclase (GGDEF)-like protein